MTRTLEILARLVAFPTVSRESNLALIDWVQDFLVKAGFEVTRLWSPDRSKAGLFARTGPHTGGGVCLSAHTDVVPVEGQTWTRPAFALTEAEGRVFGRGTTDMKGFLAAALALAERAGTSAMSAPLSLSISYDEEIGCVGMQHMLPGIAQQIGTPRLVIVGEPTSMQVAVGHKGKMALDLGCYGQAGHSALAPDFVNAVHVAADLVQGLRDLQNRLAKGVCDAAYSIPYSTVHIGQITGGRALNIVPSDTRLAVEFRHLAAVPARDILDEIRSLAARVSAGFPDVAPVVVEQVNAYPALDTDALDPAVAFACDLACQTETTKVPFGTEAGFFAQLGLRTVVIGPGDMASDGHKPDEGISKAQLAACDAMMDRVLNSLG